MSTGCILWALLWLTLMLVSAPQTFAQGGIPLWTNRYDGPANFGDVAYATAVDGNGNVYVTGYSIDANGEGFGDYATVAYSGAGVPLWTNRYNGPANSDDSAYAVAVDSSGNVFATGSSYGVNSAQDYATIKYSSAGVALWTNRYNGPGNSEDSANAVAVDSSGNVLVTGYSLGSGRSFDYATIKYSSAGVALWTNRYEGPGNDFGGPGNDYAHALAVDSSGNVFVTGYSYGGTNTDNDYATIAYSSAGVALWTNRYNGPGNGSDFAHAMAVDRSGNVFVTGQSYGGTNTDYDYATIKYSAAGVALWTNRYNGPGNYTDSALALAVDHSGNAFVTGISSGGDYATIKYSSAGVPLWTNRYNGPGNVDDWAQAVAVDGSGNVFVTGVSYSGTNTYNDYATLAYSSAGAALWTNRYDGGNTIDSALAMAVDSSGNVFVTGSGSDDYVTIKYSSSLPLPLLSIARDGSGGLFIRHTGVPDVKYRLQRAVSLAGPWSDVSTNIAPASGLIEYHETTPPPGGAFYRAIQLPVMAPATGTVTITGTFTSDSGEHAWSLTLYGTTHSHRQGWYGTRYGYVTEVQATSFDLRFTGPDADDLNRVASEQFAGGQAGLQLRNVYDFGYNLSTMALWVSSLDESATFWAGNEQYFTPGLFPWDAYGYPIVTPQPFSFWNEETYLSWYGDFYAHDEEGGYLLYLHNAEISGSLGSVDPPPPPTLGIGDASVVEGDRGSTTLRFTVSRSGSGPEAVSVSYRTVDGTASANSDYSAASGTLTFPTGISTLTITIAVTGDRKREPNETFTVELFNAVGASVGDAVATGTILNDD